MINASAAARDARYDASAARDAARDARYDASAARDAARDARDAARDARYAEEAAQNKKLESMLRAAMGGDESVSACEGD